MSEAPLGPIPYEVWPYPPEFKKHDATEKLIVGGILADRPQSEMLSQFVAVSEAGDSAGFRFDAREGNEGLADTRSLGTYVLQDGRFLSIRRDEMTDPYDDGSGVPRRMGDVAQHSQRLTLTFGRTRPQGEYPVAETAEGEEPAPRHPVFGVETTQLTVDIPPEAQPPYSPTLRQPNNAVVLYGTRPDTDTGQQSEAMQRLRKEFGDELDITRDPHSGKWFLTSYTNGREERIGMEAHAALADRRALDQDVATNIDTMAERVISEGDASSIGSRILGFFFKSAYKEAVRAHVREKRERAFMRLDKWQ